MASVIQETETVVKYACCTCGAIYSSGPAKRLHIHHDDWKRMKVTRPKPPSVITYQERTNP